MDYLTKTGALDFNHAWRIKIGIGRNIYNRGKIEVWDM